MSSMWAMMPCVRSGPTLNITQALFLPLMGPKVPWYASIAHRCRVLRAYPLFRTPQRSAVMLDVRSEDDPMTCALQSDNHNIFIWECTLAPCVLLSSSWHHAGPFPYRSCVNVPCNMLSLHWMKGPLVGAWSMSISLSQSQSSVAT